jgi:hypothetical protein
MKTLEFLPEVCEFLMKIHEFLAEAREFITALLLLILKNAQRLRGRERG